MTIFGWDMSHFDAPSIGTAVGEGISFITHKAGGDQADPELAVWWSGVKDDAIAGRVLAGAYWVLYPGSPVARADAFLARLDAACPGWRNLPFILQADCEKWNGDPGTVPSRLDIQAFCARLQFRMPKLKPIVYAPKWVYGDSLIGLGCPLWASSYVSGAGPFRSLYPGDGSPKWGSYSGRVPAILQYSSSAVIGGQTTCDANAYRGTLAQLQALVAPGWETDVTPDDVNTLFNTDGIITAPPNSQNDGFWTGGQFFRNGYNEAKAAHAAADEANTALAALATQVTAIQTALAGLTPALLGALVPAVVAALPPGVTVTEAQLATALVDALKQMAAGAA